MSKSLSEAVNFACENLPELPESGMGDPAYSADQMREYGLLCRRAALSNAEPVETITCKELSNLVANGKKFIIPDIHPSSSLPLSEDKLQDLAEESRFWTHHFGYSNFHWKEFGRAIEAAHGIGLLLTNTGK